MNRYVEQIMNSQDGLPKTFQEYQMLHPVLANKVPISHVQKLRDEFDKSKVENKPFKKIDFN